MNCNFGNQSKGNRDRPKGKFVFYFKSDRRYSKKCAPHFHIEFFYLNFHPSEIRKILDGCLASYIAENNFVFPIFIHRNQSAPQNIFSFTIDAPSPSSCCGGGGRRSQYKDELENIVWTFALCTSATPIWSWFPENLTKNPIKWNKKMDPTTKCRVHIVVCVDAKLYFFSFFFMSRKEAIQLFYFLLPPSPPVLIEGGNAQSGMKLLFLLLLPEL